jgi:hypothetical protein
MILKIVKQRIRCFFFYLFILLAVHHFLFLLITITSLHGAILPSNSILLSIHVCLSMAIHPEDANFHSHRCDNLKPDAENDLRELNTRRLRQKAINRQER